MKLFYQGVIEFRKGFVMENQKRWAEAEIKQWVIDTKPGKVAGMVGVTRQSLYNYIKNGSKKHRFIHLTLENYLNKSTPASK